MGTRRRPTPPRAETANPPADRRRRRARIYEFMGVGVDFMVFRAIPAVARSATTNARLDGSDACDVEER